MTERFYFCTMNLSIENIYSRFIAQKKNVCTDTRKISEGCIFFALRGENFNGNDFANDALSKGAAHVVVDDKRFAKSEKFIFTENVLVTLQQLAAFHRGKLKTKIIAVTGSNGKTTTKELIHSVLSQKFKTVSTQGNLNNHIGVPLTLLALTKVHEFAVIEMGANHIGEISSLCSIAQPGCGLITNVGKAHLEGFGGFEGVKRAKKELYDCLKKSGGKIFINADNPYLKELCGDYKNTCSYGNSEFANCIGKAANQVPFVKISWHEKKSAHIKNIIQSNLAGDYNFENILASVCIGNYFGITPRQIRHGIENYFPASQRSQLVKNDSNTFLLDYYNANPTSMEAALINFERNFTGKKIVVLGDMLELGEETEDEHSNIIRQLKKMHFTEMILVGECFLKFSFRLFRMKARFYQTPEEALKYLISKNYENCTFLIKASRAVKLEKIAHGLGV